MSTSFRLEIAITPDGHYVVTSPNLPGLLLAGRELQPLLNDAPLAVKMLRELDHQGCPYCDAPTHGTGHCPTKLLMDNASLICSAATVGIKHTVIELNGVEAIGRFGFPHAVYCTGCKASYAWREDEMKNRDLHD